MVRDGNDKMYSVKTGMQTTVGTREASIEVCGTFMGREPVSWSLTRDGILVISGLGRIPDLSCGRNPAPPWEDKKHMIRELVIREGIDEIGIRAFEGCEFLRKVQLPETLCRIGAYAFSGCTRLEEVTIPEAISLCYIYEDVSDSEDMDLLFFGVQSFYRTPWAMKTWGNYYIRNGILYACFTGEDHLDLPPGIHTISRFAFAYTAARTVGLPDTVKEIRDYAFSCSRLTSVSIPESAEEIGDYAFSGTELTVVAFPTSWKEVRRALIDQLLHRTSPCSLEEEEDERISLPSLYEVVLQNEKDFSPFRRITVREKKPKAPRKDSGAHPQCIYGTWTLRPGISLQRKIRRGSILLGIGYDDTQVQTVTSLSWNRFHGLLEIYKLYPCIDEEEGDIAAWKDTQGLSWHDSIVRFFDDIEGRPIDREQALYSWSRGKYQQWFWSDGKGFYNGHYYGGSLEIDLLKAWIRQHPELEILSDREYDRRDRIRKAKEKGLPWAHII